MFRSKPVFKFPSSTVIKFPKNSAIRFLTTCARVSHALFLGRSVRLSLNSPAPRSPSKTDSRCPPRSVPLSTLRNVTKSRTKNAITYQPLNVRKFLSKGTVIRYLRRPASRSQYRFPLQCQDKYVSRGLDTPLPVRNTADEFQDRQEYLTGDIVGIYLVLSLTE